MYKKENRGGEIRACARVHFRDFQRGPLPVTSLTVRAGDVTFGHVTSGRSTAWIHLKCCLSCTHILLISPRNGHDECLDKWIGKWTSLFLFSFYRKFELQCKKKHFINNKQTCAFSGKYCIYVFCCNVHLQNFYFM